MTQLNKQPAPGDRVPAEVVAEQRPVPKHNIVYMQLLPASNKGTISPDPAEMTPDELSVFKERYLTKRFKAGVHFMDVDAHNRQLACKPRPPFVPKGRTYYVQPGEIKPFRKQ